MDKAQQKVFDRIKKLLTLGVNEGATDGEQHAALKQARLLMDKYNLDDQAFLGDDETPTHELRDKVEDKPVHSRTNFHPWTYWMAMAIAEFCDASCYVTEVDHVKGKNGRWGKRLTIRFYGIGRDVAVAIALYRELYTTALAMTKLRFGKYDQNYLKGFARGLRWKLDQAKEEAVLEAGTTAIVVRKDAVLAEYAQGLGLGKGKASKAQVTDYDSYQVGNADGRAQEVGRTSLTSDSERSA